MAAAVLLVTAGCAYGQRSQSAESPTPSSSAPHGPSFVEVSPAVQPCALLTGDEVSALAGTQIFPLSGGGPVPLACQYADSGGTSEVTVLIHTYADRASARADFDGLSNGYLQEGDTAVPVPDVGDAAAIFHFASAGDAILFTKAAVFVGITVQPAATDDALTNAASTAAGRLP